MRGKKQTTTTTKTQQTKPKMKQQQNNSCELKISVITFFSYPCKVVLSYICLHTYSKDTLLVFLSVNLGKVGYADKLYVFSQLGEWEEELQFSEQFKEVCLKEKCTG